MRTVIAAIETIFTAWASISSWFTPSVLFCLVNLTIFIIVASSDNFISLHKNPPYQNQNHSDHNPTQHSGGRRDDAAKSFCSTYDPGIHPADSFARISFEVLETLPTREQPNDCVPLLSPGRLTLEDCVQQEKSPDLPRVTQINEVEQRLTKLPRYLGGLTAQKWATRKGYSLGEERPFEVRHLSMDEKLDSRLQLIHVSQLARSSPRALALPEGGEIVRSTALSSSEFAATNNRAHLVSQDQSGSTASHYECKNTREMSDKQGLEDLEQHFGCKHKHAVKSLGVSGSMFKGTYRQQWVYWWPVWFKNNAKRICRQLVIDRETTAKRIRWQLGTHRWAFKQSAISLPDGGHILSLSEKKIGRKTLKRKCRSISVLSLEDHKQHVDRRWEGAAKSHDAKRICRQLVIHRFSTAKRIRKQHGIHWWPFQRSFMSLPDGGHILPLSEKKILGKTLKRKCRGMSVLSLVDCQQHVDRRWEDAAKNIGAKRICRQLVIHRVSIAKRMCRQHGIYHRWPFQQDLATMKRYSLGDERPVEVISLSTHVKLVSRLQLIYISWLSRFSPWPSALAGGGEVGGPIALSLSESAATKNIAQRVGQDQSGSAASDSENERTREQEEPEEIYTSITSDDLRRLKGRMNRKDAAASLGVSESTFKRKCRDYGIRRWPHVRKQKVGRPPDQHGEGNTSTAHRMLSYNVQPGMEGELVGQNQEANQFGQYFMEEFLLNVPNEAGISSEWAFQLKNQWKVPTSYPNSNGPEVPRPHIASTQTLGENMGSLGDRRNSFGSLEEHLLQGHISGSVYTVPPCSDPASSQHIPTIPPTMGSSEDQINLLTFLEDVFLEEDVSGSISCTIPSCSEPAQSQPLPTVPRTTGSSDDLGNLLPSVEESFLAGHVSGFINPTVPSCSYLALSQPMPTVPHTTGSSDDLRNSLASVEEPFPAGHVSESINLTVRSGSDPAPSQSMPTILHTMPTNPRMMPLLIERQDTRSVNLKATYGDTTIKFQFPLTSGVNELKEEVSNILECKLGSFNIEYKDDDGDWILMARDENVREYLRLLTSLGNQVTKLKGFLFILLTSSDAGIICVGHRC